MNKKNIIIIISIMSFATAFGIIGILSNIKAFNIVAAFLWLVIIIDNIIKICKAN